MWSLKAFVVRLVSGSESLLHISMISPQELRESHVLFVCAKLPTATGIARPSERTRKGRSDVQVWEVELGRTSELWKKQAHTISLHEAKTKYLLNHSRKCSSQGKKSLRVVRKLRRSLKRKNETPLGILDSLRDTIYSRAVLQTSVHCKQSHSLPPPTIFAMSKYYQYCYLSMLFSFT